MRIIFTVIALLALSLSSPLRAASDAGKARAEINALLDRLESSGCQFNRNGSWHTATEAKAHLLSKLSYFETRGTLQSAEQFIDLAASKSSVTGKTYQVVCAGTPSTESKLWLSRELKAVRSSGKIKP